ncbi:MAG: hypothetical protein FWH22_11775 [Fibromonadales bacterium]|nr:hypothetical protein [Fibromonadales bacterium]
MLSKVLVQARVDHTVPIALSQKAIKENSTEDGNWLFDERERNNALLFEKSNEKGLIYEK